MSFISRSFIFIIVIFAGTRTHAAAKTVTLLGVSGADGPRFAGALAEDLGELYELVPGERYRATAARLGRDGASPADVHAVAAALRIDAVIGGAIVGQGRERVLLIAVRAGASGQVVARARYALGGRTLPLIRERVVAELVRALEHLSRLGSAEAAASPRAAEAPADDDRAPTPAEDVAPAVAGAPTLAIARSAAGAAPTAGVFAGVGPALLTRRLGFDVASAPTYAGGTVAGMRVEGAVFPLALSSELAAEHPVLASFGLAGSYEQIFGFTTQTGGGQSRGTVSRWNARFVGRIPLGHAAAGGTLTLDTGWQRISWSQSAPVDVGVPDVRYDAVAAGLGWARALGGHWALLDVRAGYLGVIHAGDITSDAQYGAARAAGFSASASLTSWLTGWLWLRLQGDYDVVALSFAGAGTRFAHTAADHFIGGALEVGFAL